MARIHKPLSHWAPAVQSQLNFLTLTSSSFHQLYHATETVWDCFPSPAQFDWHFYSVSQQQTRSSVCHNIFCSLRAVWHPCYRSGARQCRPWCLGFPWRTEAERGWSWWTCLMLTKHMVLLSHPAVQRCLFRASWHSPCLGMKMSQHNKKGGLKHVALPESELDRPWEVRCSLPNWPANTELGSTWPGLNC